MRLEKIIKFIDQTLKSSLRASHLENSSTSEYPASTNRMIQQIEIGTFEASPIGSFHSDKNEHIINSSDHSSS